MVEYAPDWLFEKLSTAGNDELMLIAMVLWGIWFFRNKKVWDNKVVNNVVAMDCSAKYPAQASRATPSNTGTVQRQPASQKWTSPIAGSFKLNVDAAIRLGEDSLSVGLVLRDHLGSFIAGKVRCMKMVNSVFEAEVFVIKEVRFTPLCSSSQTPSRQLSRSWLCFG